MLIRYVVTRTRQMSTKIKITDVGQLYIDEDAMVYQT